VLSKIEQRIALVSLLIFLLASIFSLGVLAITRTVQVPVVGGTITEALVGEPKYLNPLDAPANAVDRDLTSLIYSGLFRMNGMDAEPDLAERYEWSSDGKTLTVTIRNDAYFHHGKSVTADDVKFTIDSIQDPARTSPLAPRFKGIKTTATDTRVIQFVLERPDATFLTALTAGILPSDKWQEIPPANARLADINLKPVGSGPYKFKSFTRDSRGFIRSMTLERFDKWYGVKPYLKTIVFQFYPDRKQAEDALQSDLVNALAATKILNDKKTPPTRWHTIQLDLPQETIAFFNLKKKTVADEKVRIALSQFIDRQEILEIWNGRATQISEPFPYTVASSTVIDVDKARVLLNDAGWRLPTEGNVRIYSKSSSTSTPVATSTSQELSLTIITSDQPELSAVAESLKRRWSLLGVKVTVETLTQEELLRRATRERDAEIILTNILLNPELDIFPFWWSGEASDRGLNISGLADRDVDAALEATRSATNTQELKSTRETLSKVIQRSNPAIFLARPTVTYLVSNKFKGVNPLVVTSQPSDRFHDLMNWYEKTGWRWK
jgi:peptide/nickel transport system substrate-binding protein